MIQPTSLEAYKDILQRLGDKQRVVYDVIVMVDKPITNIEIAEYLIWAINCVTGRVRELVQLGVVEEACKVKNEFGRNVIAWQIVKKGQLTMF